MRQLAVLAFIIFTGTRVESRTPNSKEVCKLNKHEGETPCDKSTEINWFFNGRYCELFNFSGCGGNENNFQRMDDCQRLCENQTHFHFDSPKYVCFKDIMEYIPENNLAGIPKQSMTNDKNLAQVCFKVKEYWVFDEIANKALPEISVQSEEDEGGDENN